MKKTKKRIKKLFKVLKKRWFKPALYTIAVAYIVYMVTAHVIIVKKTPDDNLPHFIITNLSNRFEKVEFMHLLLCVQELSKTPETKKMLVDFVNTPFPAPCPQELEQQLKLMNWAPHAFHTRVQKMFAMQDIYEHLSRLDNTIYFLSQEIENKNLPSPAITSQIDMLEEEKAQLIKDNLSSEEYEFLKDYNGLIQTIRRYE